jgi:hypothetical protein
MFGCQSVCIDSSSPPQGSLVQTSPARPDSAALLNNIVTK